MYIVPYFISLYKSRNLKVISMCDQSYNSYEWSEAKIFIIWAIIKCPMIDQGGLWVINVIYERTEHFVRDHSFVFWCTPYNLSFTLFHNYIQEQESQGYSYDRSYNSYEQSEAKIFIIWAIIKCLVIDQGGAWAINVIYEWTEVFCKWSYFCLLMYPR